MSDFTDAELSALRRAYATGTLRVTYDGKTVEYGSGADLLARIRVIESEMATATTGGPKVMSRFTTVRRGE